ncbi:hypothetical protein [Planctomicrobium piriforme]|uniref:Uncharacterized protein n=1 Tax=Planctomicrobium piriforme TaxID=1576369 RepID=A0A1I3IPT8_9PLAN|nr:hypothetical protein [Planctomicrobium piriforme]SFI49870.1 hypothetical protein SAMN05421753_109205 [Planctomicrobium piriforme]
MFTLRIPGHRTPISGPPELAGTKEEIARQLLFPNPEQDVNGIRSLPRDADCILEETLVISKGRESRQEVTQVGRWAISQLLPPKLLNGLF